MTIDTKRLETDAAYWDSAAPEGATHYNEECVCPWLKESPASYYVAGIWSQYSTIDNAVHDILGATPRPQAPEAKWADGLPPVDAELDYVIGNDRYPVTVVGHFEGEVVVFQHESAPDYVGVQPGYLQPRRTKEQRQRDELAVEIWAINGGTKDHAYAIADAVIEFLGKKP